MSKTGHYRYIDGKWIKVSDRPGTVDDAYVPAGGYTDETLGHYDSQRESWVPARIETKSQKAALMRAKGVVEDGGWKKVVKRKYFHA